jgi:hypothetical protein
MERLKNIKKPIPIRLTAHQINLLLRKQIPEEYQAVKDSSNSLLSYLGDLSDEEASPLDSEEFPENATAEQDRYRLERHEYEELLMVQKVESKQRARERPVEQAKLRQQQRKKQMVDLDTQEVKSYVESLRRPTRPLLVSKPAPEKGRACSRGPRTGPTFRVLRSLDSKIKWLASRVSTIRGRKESFRELLDLDVASYTCYPQVSYEPLDPDLAFSKGGGIFNFSDSDVFGGRAL